MANLLKFQANDATCDEKIKVKSQPKYVTPPTDDDDDLDVVWMTDVKEKIMPWLWMPYIPEHKVTAIFGRGGIGKSTYTAELAARLSGGAAFPGDTATREPFKILMLSAEDDAEAVIKPRLMAAGADMSRIAIPKKRFVLDAMGVRRLRELIKAHGFNAVFIDPVVYYVGGKVDTNKANEVRNWLEPLDRIASEEKATIVIVGHVKKGDAGIDQEKMSGSADWVNASRSAMLVTETNDGTTVVKHVKNNYGPLGPTISFEIDDERTITIGDKPVNIGRFVFGEVIEDGPKQRISKRKIGQAAAFLRTILANGPVPAKEVEQMREDAGIATKTLDRAKIGLAESVYSKSRKCWIWQLLPQR